MWQVVNGLDNATLMQKNNPKVIFLWEFFLIFSLVNSNKNLAYFAEVVKLWHLLPEPERIKLFSRIRWKFISEKVDRQTDSGSWTSYLLNYIFCFTRLEFRLSSSFAEKGIDATWPTFPWLKFMTLFFLLTFFFDVKLNEKLTNCEIVTIKWQFG